MKSVTEMESEMEFLIALGAFVVIDILALRLGFDSRADLPHDEWRAIRRK